ncbi:MAG: response regulator [Bacteroidetes bacterium]|nr:response regulator [Bacteroidota bacterium]
MQNLKILIVDDVPDDAELVAVQLKQQGIKFSWKHVDNAQKLKNALTDEAWDVVITDYSMPGFDGIEALRIVNEYDEDLPVIMVSGTIGEDVAVEAMKKGVHDYLMKNNLLRLGPALLREIEDAENRRQHRKDRAALVQSEEKFRLLVENAPVGVSIASLDGKFHTVNKAYCDIVGYTERELLNMTFLELTVKDFNEKNVKIVDKLLDGKIKKARIEKQYIRKDGEIIDVVINTTVKKDEKGNPEYLIGILEDITELKKNEKELIIAKEKAEESDRLKSAFLSTMSHEFRTPLNAILGFSELIDDNLPKDEVINFVKLINKSGQLLFETIEDILEVTDIESGKSRVPKEEFNVCLLLQDLYSEMESLLEKEKKQHLEIKYHPPADGNKITFITDKSKFKKILILLLKNAIKFTHEGYIEYGFKPEQDKIVFYVKDTGIGISEDERDIVFEKFRQVDDTHTRKYGGVGLGLTLVKKLIELLDGRIWFDSELGKGSVFYFSLPYGKPEEELAVEKKTGEKKEKKLLSDKTILIVEDENSNYLLLDKLLRLENANTIWARNGEESIEKFKENKDIDLILMDLKMPVMDGYEATRQIKQLSENLPIIALTAYTKSESIEKAKSKGFDDYLEKPIKRSELFERIGEFIK